MGITKSVLRRPVTTFLVVLCLLVFGVSSFLGSKMELIPKMEMPMLVVYATYPGANPEDVNTLVTQPIEDSLGTLNGVKDITSYSNANMSFLLLQYEYGSDMDKAYDDLKKAMDGVKNKLPDDVDTPSIIEMDMNAQASMTLAVNNDAESNLYNYVDNTVVPEFKKLSSVASVDVSGGQEQYLKIELIPEKMSQYRLSISSVAQAISAADFSIPAGKTKVGDQKLSVTTGATFDTAEKLKNVPITLSSGNTIYLQDVANVRNTLKDAAGIGRYDKKDTIALALKKNDSSSAAQVSREAHRVIDRLTAENPNLQIVVVNDSADSINSSLKSVMEAMVAAVIISMIIIWLFFGDIKASMIVGTSIPVSILVALIAMSTMGFSLNVVTLGALVLGVGMMVDNSIVVLESCFRSTEGKGFDKFHEAALDGSGKVLMSIIGSTLTTCVVFLPLATLSGLSGQMFKPLGFTIVFCMLASLLSAMTIVPLCYVLYKPREREKAPLSKALIWMQNGYRGIMEGFLQKKKRVMLVSVALLIFSLFLATKIHTELMPATDDGEVQISISIRPGADMQKAGEIFGRVEDFIEKDPDVDHFLLSYGSTGLSVQSGSSGTLTAYLKKDRSRSTKEIINEWKPVLTAYPDCRITLTMSSSTSMSGSSNESDVQYMLQGSQYDELKNASDEVVSILKERGDITQIHSTLENSAPVVKIDVDPLKAQAEGLSPAAIGSTVNMMLSGNKAMTLKVNSDDIEVRVEYPDDEYDTVEDVQSIILPNSKGGSVALADVADIYFEDSPRSIQRKNKQYQVTISGAFAGDVPAKEKTAISDQIYRDVVAPKMRNGITRAQSLQTEMMNDEFASLGKAILTAIFLIFVVMAAQFESPKFSLMVMSTIPFSLIGVFGSLFFFDISISMTSLLGFLMLVGTVVNNGILYLDTANQYRMTMDQKTALIEAGATRLRPILMTTMTTVLSMIPMAATTSGSGQVMQGLAMVNIGGLTASTVLSLLMLPVYYAVVSRRSKVDAMDID